MIKQPSTVLLLDSNLCKKRVYKIAIYKYECDAVGESPCIQVHGSITQTIQTHNQDTIKNGSHLSIILVSHLTTIRDFQRSFYSIANMNKTSLTSDWNIRMVSQPLIALCSLYK